MSGVSLKSFILAGCKRDTHTTPRYKEEFDPEKIPQFGLIAKQVEKVDP